MVIEDNNQELAIDAISLVSAPAIEQDFVFFNKEKNNLTLAKVDEEKRMLVSPALIPNKQIFRYDPNSDSEYYVYFSKETVRQASELYLKHNNHHKATYEHSDRVSGVLTVESWIKEGDSDKSKMYGFDLPNGTWFVKMKIENDDLWEKVKTKEVVGLSIEGYFVDKMQKMGTEQFSNKQIKQALKELLSVQKVELGAIDDLRKNIEKSYELFAEGNKIIQNTDKKINSLYEKVKKLRGTLNNNLKGLENDAKELGINYTDIPVVKQYFKADTALTNLIKKLIERR